MERQLAVEQGRDTTMHYMMSLPLLAVSVPPQILTTWLNKSLQSGLHSVIHSDKSGTTDLAIMFSKIKAALEEQTLPEANQLVLSQVGCPFFFNSET